ncbi:MAG: hypothetical protein ACUVQH_05165 [Thermogutta sp.]
MPKVNQKTAELKTKCVETFERGHGGSLSPPTRERLDRELALVERLGRVEDFLAAVVVGRFADENDIPLRLAGAGSSSFAAFCLDLTQVDPIRHRLVIERFLGSRADEPIPFCLEVEANHLADVWDFAVSQCGANLVDERFQFSKMSADAAIPHVVARLLRNKGRQFRLATIPTDDQRTFELIQAGDTSGIFQLNGATTTKRLTELVPKTIEDLAFAAALESMATGHDGTIGQLVDNGIIATCPDEFGPQLGEFMESTRRLILFQEQIMSLLGRFGHIDLSEGYRFVKAAAKQRTETFAAYADRFIESATKQANREAAEELYRQIWRAGRYARCKAHYVANAMTTYQAVFLKAHYPDGFAEAVRLAAVTGP